MDEFLNGDQNKTRIKIKGLKMNFTRCFKLLCKKVKIVFCHKKSRQGFAVPLAAEFPIGVDFQRSAGTNGRVVHAYLPRFQPSYIAVGRRVSVLPPLIGAYFLTVGSNSLRALQFRWRRSALSSIACCHLLSDLLVQ